MYELLVLIGIDFELSKCGWYILEWKFDEKGKVYIQQSTHKLFFQPLEEGKDQFNTIDFKHIINILWHNISSEWKTESSIEYTSTKSKRTK